MPNVFTQVGVHVGHRCAHPSLRVCLGSLALVEFVVFVVTRTLGVDLACRHRISHKSEQKLVTAPVSTADISTNRSDRRPATSAPALPMAARPTPTATAATCRAAFGGWPLPAATGHAGARRAAASV